jgi:uncharacterized protein RhaS with RHS repeats
LIVCTSQNGYRDYDPALGRYTQSDPVGLNGGPNTFAYAKNTPEIRIDPHGLFSVSVEDTWTMAQQLNGGRIGLTNGSMSSSCECKQSCGRWSLAGCHVDFRITVQILAGLPVRAEAFSRAAEMQHVVDMHDAGPRLKKQGQEVESSQRNRTYSSQYDCVDAAQKRMQASMTNAMAEIFYSSQQPYDHGPHHYYPPYDPRGW